MLWFHSHDIRDHNQDVVARTPRLVPDVAVRATSGALAARQCTGHRHSYVTAQPWIGVRAGKGPHHQTAPRWQSLHDRFQTPPNAPARPMPNHRVSDALADNQPDEHRWISQVTWGQEITDHPAT
jgi:hypothetical protein